MRCGTRLGCAYATSWVTAVQVHHEHFDRRAARVVRPPVQSPLSVRPPGTLRAWLRHLRVGARLESAGLWLDAVRHAIRGACFMSWVRPCRTIENTPIAALHESFTRLSQLEYLCVRRAAARVAAACAPGARWSPPGCGWGCGWMRCGTRSDARVRCRGFGRAGRSGTCRSPRCPSRSPACPISNHCACAGQLRAWQRHVRVRCTFESAGLCLVAVRHAIGCACADVMGSAVQVDH
jgi:hypothetical protein